MKSDGLLVKLISLLFVCLLFPLGACRPNQPSTNVPTKTSLNEVQMVPTLTASATHVKTAPVRVIVVVPPTATTIIIPTATLSACTARANFGDAAESPYILPYPVGERYRVIQSYCDPNGGHANQLAYDFNLPVGADVLAARAGTVIELRDGSPDDGGIDYINQHNYIMIQHSDFTVAFYAHLKMNSITVQVDQRVEAGQRIAASGNSGATGGRAHLHFGVYSYYIPAEGYDEPVVFCNAAGPLDARRGLRANVYYEALHY